MVVAIRIDVVVVVIDRVRESLTFAHFVGMPIAPCFKDTTPPTFAKLNIYTTRHTKYAWYDVV